MDAVLDIVMNLFSGIELEGVLSSMVGTLVEYDVSAALDTIISFFGGAFA